MTIRKKTDLPYQAAVEAPALEISSGSEFILSQADNGSNEVNMCITFRDERSQEMGIIHYM